MPLWMWSLGFLGVRIGLLYLFAYWLSFEEVYGENLSHL